MTRFIRSFIAVVSMLWLATGASFADVYLVKNVAVDKTAENSVQARAEAFAEARVIAANRLIQRLTTAQDRARAGGLHVNGSIASRLAAAVDVQDEKQSATRYIGLLSVKFDETAVKSFLNVYDMPFVDSQDAFALVIPEVGDGVNPDEWAMVWEKSFDKNVLAPYVASREIYLNDVSWDDVSSEVMAVSAQRAVVARAKMSGVSYFVDLYDLRQEFSDRMPVGSVGPYATMEEAKSGAVEYMENVWKSQNIVRAVGETPVSLVAKYPSHAGWVTIQSAMQNSRLIKNVTIENVSLNGADVSFSYAGRPDQLAAELRANGVVLSSGDTDWILEPVGY